MSSPLHEQPAEGLAALRVQLDQIDERLLDTLRDRVQCCIHIAELKRQWSIPMMQPHRIGIVHERAATYASIHGMSPDFLSRLYDLVIAETCRVEELVISSPSPLHDQSRPSASVSGEN